MAFPWRASGRPPASRSSCWSGRAWPKGCGRCPPARWIISCGQWTRSGWRAAWAELAQSWPPAATV